MNKILHKLNSVAGVVGNMICNNQGHVLAHLFPQNIDADILPTVTSLLVDNIPVFQKCTGGARGFNFKYETGRIIVRLENDIYFVLLCSNTVMVNLQVLDMIIDVASKQLERTINKAPENTDVMQPIQTPTTSKPTSSELIENSLLSPSLKEMQTCLTKFLGPMAKIVFNECIEKWLEFNQPTKKAFPELLTIINKEINDRNKSALFMQMVAPYM